MVTERRDHKLLRHGWAILPLQHRLSQGPQGGTRGKGVPGL